MSKRIFKMEFPDEESPKVDQMWLCDVISSHWVCSCEVTDITEEHNATKANLSQSQKRRLSHQLDVKEQEDV